MSTSPAEQTLPAGARKWTVVGAILVGGFVFSLNARGSVLESAVIIQAFALDRYKIQWITGAEAVASLTVLFSSVYLMKLIGPRRVFLIGTAFLTAGGLGETMARTPWELGVAGVVRSCAGFYPIPGLTTLQRLLPRRTRFSYCTYLTLVYGGQVVVEPIGALLTFNPSWRALFGGLGMCGACLVLIALCLFPDDRPERRPEHGFDFVGMGLFVAVLGLIFFLLYRGNYLGWRVSTPIRIAAAALSWPPWSCSSGASSWRPSHSSTSARSPSGPSPCPCWLRRFGARRCTGSRSSCLSASWRWVTSTGRRAG